MSTHPTDNDEATDQLDADGQTEPAATDTTAEADQPGTDELSADNGDSGSDDEDRGDDHPGAEAARYRRRLRDTETERDQLREQVTALQRAEVERLAGQHLAKGSALWANGAELGDLLAEDGTIDAGLVRDAAKAAQAELGLEPHRSGYIPREGGNPQSRPTGLGAMQRVVQGFDD